ncbi:MAG: amidase [Rhodospirillaceae bacterium]|jgi:Asp-tRNA(Asn)/Glu-tRNA(Gln) amidotransferase A subunit family amidase|nr:amidase [Rhodospirillaceae bacterium]
MKPPNELSAHEAAAQIESGALTSEALVAACLDRISERDGVVKAWIAMDRDQALAQARERDREPRRGPLHGVPFAVKDIIDTARLPTGYGSPIYNNHHPDTDAACVALTMANGGVLLGKTVTTEFASRYPGETTNPHDLNHTPGGSSSGSGAAVADTMVPLAFGTQTVGSVIRPAAYCGCVGYKPSFGHIPTLGVKQNTVSFDTVGLYGRAVEDLPLYRAAAMGIAPKPLSDVSVSGLKIGFCRTMFWDQAEDHTKNVLAQAVDQLSKAGAKVVDIELDGPFKVFETIGRTVTRFEFPRALAWERANHYELLSETLRSHTIEIPDISFEAYTGAQNALTACRQRFADIMTSVDVLLTPSAPGEAPRGLDYTGDARFNALATWMHTPAITLPAFTGPNGLPVGAQLVGPRNQDHELLEIAKAVYPVILNP